MIQTDILEKLSKVDLPNDLVVQKWSNSYDYNEELFWKLNGVYKMIQTAVDKITDESDPNLVAKVEMAINIFMNKLDRIKQSAEQLWENFNNHRNSIINEIRTYINEIYNAKDESQLLLVSQALKAEHYTQSTDNIVEKTINQLTDDKLGEIIKKFETAGKAVDQWVAEVESKVRKVKDIGLAEYQAAIGEDIKKYQATYVRSMIISVLLAFWLLWFLYCLKKTSIQSEITSFAEVSEKIQWILSYYYLFRVIIINLAIVSLISYLLKLTVDTYKISSNMVTSLRNKKNIITGYMLLIPESGWEGQIEIAKLLLEKTTTELFAQWSWTIFSWWTDQIPLEKAIDLTSKLVK